VHDEERTGEESGGRTASASATGNETSISISMATVSAKYGTTEVITSREARRASGRA
jgi:hypothetical protein